MTQVRAPRTACAVASCSTVSSARPAACRHAGIPVCRHTGPVLHPPPQPLLPRLAGRRARQGSAQMSDGLAARP
jgi:hypothetical protein